MYPSTALANPDTPTCILRPPPAGFALYSVTHCYSLDPFFTTYYENYQTTLSVETSLPIFDGTPSRTRSHAVPRGDNHGLSNRFHLDPHPQLGTPPTAAEKHPHTAAEEPEAPAGDAGSAGDSGARIQQEPHSDRRDQGTDSPGDQHD